MNTSGDSVADHFDLETYISNYKDHTRVARLLTIADITKSKDLAIESRRMAIKDIQDERQNTGLYRETILKGGKDLGPDFQMDNDWADTVDRKAAIRLEKLELELNGYKTNLIKESIRMGYNDLGDFHYARGDLHQAFKNYVRTRDYCTASKHIIAMCLNVIKVSIELGHFVHVNNYVQKAEQTPDVQDPIVLSKLKCAAGLANLESRKYKLAARKFVDTQFEMGTSYNDVIAPQDVATYGGLCALASFDRAELKSKVIDNIGFKQFLELVPEVRELIHDFYTSRYASCLGYLAKLKPALCLDLHLHDHVDSLYEWVRHKALIQYTHPFISVSLSAMAAAFSTSVGGVEKELAALIMENQIQARIDSHNKILYARHANQRNATFQRAIQAGAEYQRDTRALILRASLLRNDVAATKTRGKGA